MFSSLISIARCVPQTLYDLTFSSCFSLRPMYSHGGFSLRFCQVRKTQNTMPPVLVLFISLTTCDT